MKCFYCEKEIEGRYKIIPLDIPYVNLFNHLDCYREIQAIGEKKYLQENLEKIYAYTGKTTGAKIKRG